jgi:hypothetical protein
MGSCRVNYMFLQYSSSKQACGPVLVLLSLAGLVPAIVLSSVALDTTSLRSTDHLAVQVTTSMI